MEQEVIWNIPLTGYWGYQIIIYFWLVGASAGSFVISSLGWVFGIKRFKAISFFACNGSIVLLLIVPMILIHDLGKPFRFWHLMNYIGNWHYSTPMAWGSILITSYPVTMILYSYCIFRKNEAWARLWGLLAVVLAVCTHWYTGIVMELNPNRELNHTAMAAIIFLTGAFISGIGFLIVLLAIRNKFVKTAEQIVPNEFFVELGKMMAYGVAFDSFLIFSEFLLMFYGSEEEYAILTKVLLDVLAVPYVWMEIIAGLMLPFLILFSPLGSRVSFVVISSILVCIGVFGMRIWWVFGGQFLQTFY